MPNIRVEILGDPGPIEARIQWQLGEECPDYPQAALGREDFIAFFPHDNRSNHSFTLRVRTASSRFPLFYAIGERLARLLSRIQVRCIVLSRSLVTITPGFKAPAVRGARPLPRGRP